MKKKIAITTESSVDLSKELQTSLGIRVIPMNIYIADEEYKDGIDLSAKELYEKSRLYGTLPTTAGIPPHEYRKLFEKLTEKGFDVVHISISSLLSSCFQNAGFAASSFENVYVIDSRNLSAGMALLAIKASRLRNEGKDAKEIAEELEKMKTKISTSFVLEDTEYLYKGGRCTKLEKTGAALFSIKPSVEVVDGALQPGKKYIGKKLTAQKKYIDERMKKDTAIDSSVCLLNYSDMEQGEVDSLVEHLKKSHPFKRIIVNEAGCCISAHCGRGCMGIIYARK